MLTLALAVSIDGDFGKKIYAGDIYGVKLSFIASG
jgi:hypothetical protein